MVDWSLNVLVPQQCMTSCDLMLKLVQWISSSEVHRFYCGEKRALLWDQYISRYFELRDRNHYQERKSRPIQPFCYTCVIQLWKWCCSHHHNAAFTLLDTDGSFLGLSHICGDSKLDQQCVTPSSGCCGVFCCLCSKGFCTEFWCFLSLWASEHSSTQQSLSLQQRRSSGEICLLLFQFSKKKILLLYLNTPRWADMEMNWTSVDTSRGSLQIQNICRRESHGLLPKPALHLEVVSVNPQRILKTTDIYFTMTFLCLKWWKVFKLNVVIT